MRVKKLHHKIFLKTFKYIPRVAVNLVIKNNKGEILLTKRAIPPMKGYWHIPGSFLLKGETISSCITRVARKEIGIKIGKEAEFLGVFEDLDKDERGHIIDIIYGYSLKDDALPAQTEESKEINFFSTLPRKIGFNHKDYLLHISKHWVS